MLVALVAIQAAALSIYMFEWFSPIGNNQSKVTIYSTAANFALARWLSEKLFDFCWIFYK